MIKRFCDKCGKEMTEYKVVLLDIEPQLMVSAMIKDTTVKAELCEECFEKVRDAAIARKDQDGAIEKSIAKTIADLVSHV